MKIKYTIQGAVPEKDFMLIRYEGEEKPRQNPESKVWEWEIKQLLKKEKLIGWTSRADIERGEYTPLRMVIRIYTPHKTVIIKQIKAIQDALTGVLYMDDSVIVDLDVERIKSDKEYVDITLMPADKSYIRLPEEAEVILTRPIRPVRANVRDVHGYFLDQAQREKDIDWMKYVRSEFASQQEDLIEKEFSLFAVIGAYELKERTPLKDRVAAYDLESFPIITPDGDNCAYSILSALHHHEYDDPADLVKLRVIKTFYNPDAGRNRIWLRNARGKDYIITLGGLPS